MVDSPYDTDFSVTAYINWPVVVNDEFDFGVPTPHVTTIYFGDITDKEYGPGDLLNAVAGVLDAEEYLLVRVMDKAMFGVDANFPVFLLDDTMLRPLQSKVEAALKTVGAVSGSEFGFSPHVTVSAEAWFNPPESVLLAPMQLEWRNNVYPLSPSVD